MRDVWRIIHIQNLNILGLWVLTLVYCSTLTFFIQCETSNSPHTYHNNLPLKCKSFCSLCSPSSGFFFHPYTLALLLPLHLTNKSPDQNCHEDFRHKELVELLLNEALLPLFNHEESL